MSDLIGFEGDPLELIERDDAPVDEALWAPLLCDMLRVIEADKLRRGSPKADAFSDASSTVLAIAEYFGGRQVYLPKGERLKIALRDAEIWSKFTGKNARKLAETYGVSEIHMYAILKRQRALHTRKLQGRLFPD